MEFKSIHLAIFGLVGLIFWIFNYFYFFKKAEIVFPKKFGRNGLGILRGFLFIIGFLGWIFITFSLLGPRKPLGFAKNNIEVNDIFFVVDVSRSMLANDFQPNRLEAAKRKILEFVDLRPSDRIGIIMFSEKAFTLLPLSTDLELIKRMVSEIKVGFLGSGTNIGDALGLAVGRGSQSLAKNKIAILLTDGVSNVGSMTPIQAAELARDQGIKVYTIGVGGRDDAQIPLGSNRLGQFQNIPGGSIDLKTLEQISKITNAKTYLARNEKALREVLSDIGNLERTEIETHGKIIYEELYFKYLFFGVLMLILVEMARNLVIKEI
jgi:Ca-activated chloride channel family protein